MGEYVFISYKFEERDIALKIKNILEVNGISCWIAPENIPGGKSYASEIPNAIGGCKEFILVLSSLSQNSQYVVKELDLAIKYHKRVFPFVINDFDFTSAMEFYLTDVQLYSAFQSWESAIEKLIREIRWDFDSIPSLPSPDSILKDPVTIDSHLPHILEEGSILFGRYQIKKILRIFANSQQHYLAIDSHTNREVLVSYVDRTVPHTEYGFGISTSGSLFQHSYIASPIDEYSNESYFIHIEPFYNVESLDSIIRNRGPQNYHAVIKWAIAVCHAMIYLNEEMGYIYGQMNPINIRIQENGLPILFDISLATPIGNKYTSITPCHLISTPPEVYTKYYIAAPTLDIFSLGSNMLYALTGKPNLSYNDAKIIPPKLLKIINKCIDCNIQHRYSEFKSLLYDLEDFSSNQNRLGILQRIKKKVR